MKVMMLRNEWKATFSHILIKLVLHEINFANISSIKNQLFCIIKDWINAAPFTFVHWWFMILLSDGL